MEHFYLLSTLLVLKRHPFLLGKATAPLGVGVRSSPKSDLQKKTQKTPQEQEMVKREIEAMDRQIDRLVYELYGLSEEEIKIVEGQ